MRYLISILMVLVLSGCARTEYEESCIPQMTYNFPNETPFVIIELDDAPRGYIKRKRLPTGIALQMSIEDIPSTIHYKVTPIQSDKLTLLGPVLRYLRSPINSFDYSRIYFYAEIHGHNTWIPLYELRKINSDYPNYHNQKNLRKIMEGRFNTERDDTMQCIINKNDWDWLNP